MARLVTKFKYLKPNRKQKAGGYAKYIATREGAEKIDESFRYSFVSGKQCKLIEKLLKDFPETKEMHEYKDYLRVLYELYNQRKRQGLVQFRYRDGSRGRNTDSDKG